MVEIRHLENRHDVIFFCRGWSDLDKISDIFIRFGATHERDGWTDRQTPGDGNSRAMHSIARQKTALEYYDATKLTTDIHEASCGLFAIAELLVIHSITKGVVVN